MAEFSPIPIPRRRFWQAIRRSLLPVVVWLGAVGAVATLMNLRMSPVNAVGLAEEMRADVTVLVDGSVRMMYADLFDNVERGRIIAVLDDQLISRQIESARRELKRLKSEYEMAALELDFERSMAKLDYSQRLDVQKLDALATMRRLELDRDEARIEYLDRRVNRAADQAELVYRDALVEAYSGAADVIAPIDVEEARAERAALQVQVDMSAETVDEARTLYQATEERLTSARKELNQIIDSGDEVFQELMLAFGPAIRMQPLSDAISVQESLIEELLQQKQQMILRSPIDGIIASVDTTVGSSILRGTRVMEIHAPEVPYIRGWIDQNSGYQPQVGGEVLLVTRSIPHRSMKGQVVKVGQRIERFPLRLRPNPNLPQFGRTIMITGFGEGLFPGEVLDIRFL